MSEITTKKVRKQDMPDYWENRKLKKREQSKQRYDENPEVKEKMKAKSRVQYQQKKLALELIKKEYENALKQVKALNL